MLSKKNIDQSPRRDDPTGIQKLRSNYLLYIGSASLLLYCGMSYLSKHFIYGTGYADRPIILFLSLYLLLFLFYFLAIYFIPPSPSSKTKKINLKIILIFAVLFRIVLLPSNPIQEDDFYRYMWDGKVLLKGVNPYKYSPGKISEFTADFDKGEYTHDEIKELELLNLLRFDNSQTETLFDRINHPDVPTIYPPFSQTVFIIAEFIFGGTIIGLRVVLLLFDLLTVWVVLLLLKQQKLNPLHSIIYAWSPLVIKEISNSLHIESIPLLFLTGSLYLLLASRTVSSMFLYALSILSKYYSVILFPVFFARICKERGLKIVAAGLALFFTLVFFCLPFLEDEWSIFKGLVIYGNQWERNDSIFALINFFIGNHQTTLLVVSLLFLFILGYVTYNTISTIQKVLVLLSAFFLLIPTQYPWYFIFTLPFLSLYPNRSLLLLSCLLSVYYLEFYFAYHQTNDLFLLIARWFEYFPFYILLIYDILKRCDK